VKEFASYHLPERSFLYLLHAIREDKQSPRKVIDAPDWRMFLMRPSDVEYELLRLHQFRKLEYHVAAASCSSVCRAPARASTRRGWWHERP